jgi:hypothetical protein
LKRELNKLHILFSEKKFSKPGLTDSNKLESVCIVPKSSSLRQTADWLAKTKFAVDDFIDYQIYF